MQNRSEFVEVRGFVLQMAVDPKHVPPDKVSVLHTAALGGSWAICEELLSQGCDLKGETLTGLTPLHCAAIGISIKSCL